MEYTDEQIANMASLYHTVVANSIAVNLVGIESPSTLQKIANNIDRYSREVPEGVRRLLKFDDEGLLKKLQERGILPN